MLVSGSSSNKSLHHINHSPRHQVRGRHNIDIHPIDRYKLMEKIGQGGFGYVYKAFDSVTGDIVACKLINLDDAGMKLFITINKYFEVNQSPIIICFSFLLSL